MVAATNSTWYPSNHSISSHQDCLPPDLSSNPITIIRLSCRCLCCPQTQGLARQLLRRLINMSSQTFQRLRQKYYNVVDYVVVEQGRRRFVAPNWGLSRSSDAYFLRAKRLLRRASTLPTSNCTYSRSRSSWPSFCISSRSSSLRSSSSRPRARPIAVQSLSYYLGMSNVPL